MTKKSSKIKIVVICIAVIIVIAALLIFVSGNMNGNGNGNGNGSYAIEEAQRGIVVDTTTPEIGSIVVVGEYIGTMEPNQQVTVFPKTAGEVLSVYFGVGDTVNAGDVLFRMDATDIHHNIRALEAQLAAQDAAVRAAQTGVSQADGSAMQSQILSASGGVQQAETAVNQAKQNVEQALIAIEQRELAYNDAAKLLKDTSMLFEAGAVSRAVFEQTEIAYLNAKSALEQAQNSLNIAVISESQAQSAYEQARESHEIVTGLTPAENKQRAQDALAAAQAGRSTAAVGLQTATDRLDDATIRAPISGVIEVRNIEPFNMAGPQTPAMVISDKNSMTVSFKVPRDSFAHMALGDEITLNDGDSSYAGIITEISTMVDTNGLFTVLANIPDPSGSLFNGAQVRILADAQRATDILLVPLSVVHFENGVPFIYVVENGIARKRQAEVGIFDADYIQIISGVQLGDQIITTWNSRLSDGVEIILVSEADLHDAEGDIE